jgi:hypothetical protein
MLLIVLILVVAYILIPLLELTLTESIQRIAKIVVYAVTFCWIVYQLFVSKAV